MTTLTYMLESVAAGALICSFLRIAMRREGRFGYVRFLWLLGMVLTALLPFTRLRLGFMEGFMDGFMQRFMAGDGAQGIATLLLPEALAAPDGVAAGTGAAGAASGAASGIAGAAGTEIISDILLAVYLAGGAACLALCAFWLVLLRRKIRGCHKAGAEETALLESLKLGLGIRTKTRLLITDDDTAPFSWMHTIVVSKNDLGEGLRDVLVHELTHVRMHHSMDLALSEAILVAQWFNPFFYLMRKSLVLTHDYDADQAVLDSGADGSEYQKLLITKAVGARHIQIAEGLNKSNLKKRIIMMTDQKRFGAVWKSLLGLPLVAIMAVAFGCSNSARAQKPADEGQAAAAETETAAENAKAAENATAAETATAAEADIPEITVVTYVDNPPAAPADEVSDAATGGEATPTGVNAASAGVKEAPAGVKAKVADGQGKTKTAADYIKNGEPVPVQLVDKMPRFQGEEMYAFARWVSMHIAYPKEEKDKKIQGKVITQFVINEDGSLSDLKVVSSPDKNLSDAALKVLKESPAWEPGTIDGKPVKVSFMFPVMFRLN